jgi:hypothetical protein
LTGAAHSFVWNVFRITRKETTMSRVTSLFVCIVSISGATACALDPGTSPSLDSTEQAVLLADDEAPLDAFDVDADLGQGAKLLPGMPPGVEATLIAPIGLATLPSCPRGAVCVWQNSNRGGQGFALRFSATAGFLNLANIPCPANLCNNGRFGNDGSFDNQMSSWENEAGRRFCWTALPLGNGVHHPGNDRQFINVTAGENDTASSVGPC